jgi:uncharacterized protein YggU (UPF0235/DUF167 family)
VTTRLALRVSPGARNSPVVGRHGKAWKVRVAAPEARVTRTRSVPARTISVVSGHGARDKLVELAGIAPDETERRLEAAGRKEPRA